MIMFRSAALPRQCVMCSGTSNRIVTATRWFPAFFNLPVGLKDGLGMLTRTWLAL